MHIDAVTMIFLFFVVVGGIGYITYKDERRKGRTSREARTTTIYWMTAFSFLYTLMIGAVYWYFY